MIDWDLLASEGEKNLKEPVPVVPDDIYAFCYTSGTTGNPKGAMISHGNMVSSVAALVHSEAALNNTDVHLSYLPLPHLYERLIITGIIHAGGAVGFYSGDVLKLKEDLAELKPTVFPSVPRLYNRFYDGINKCKKISFKIRVRASNWDEKVVD